ncbi:GNAT family N-acetyltransferase [Streptomyces bauhiniae]
MQSLYYALPEGADPGAKVLLLLAPWARGRGVGRAVAESLLARGASRVTATVPAGWTAGERFLEGLGFTLEAGVLRRAEWLRES